MSVLTEIVEVLYQSLRKLTNAKQTTLICQNPKIRWIIVTWLFYVEIVLYMVGKIIQSAFQRYAARLST